MRHLLFVVVLLATSFLPSLARAAETDAAVDAAKTYMQRLISGETHAAIRECWDIDTMLGQAFGLMYLGMTEDDRNRTQTALINFVAAPFGNAQIAELFKTFEVQEAKATLIDPTTVSVRFQLKGADGFKSVNTLLLSRINDAWRITDQSQGEQVGSHFSIRATLVLLYTEAAKGAQVSLPVAMERTAADAIKHLQAK